MTLYSELNAHYVSIVLTISLIIPLLLVAVFNRNLPFITLRLHNDMRYVRQYMRGAVTIWLSHLMGMLQARAPILLVSNFFSMSQVGIFGIVSTLSEPTLRLGTVFSRFIVRWSSNTEYGFDFDQFMTRSLPFVVLLSVLQILIYHLLAEYFFEFDSSAYIGLYLTLLSHSTLLLYVNFLASNLYGKGMAVVVVRASMISTAVMFLLVYISSAFFVSLQAVAISMLCGSAIILILLIKRGRKMTLSGYEY